MHIEEKRILVVDDDNSIRSLLLTVFRRRGFAVDLARHGAEALEHIARCHYTVMLLDLMMPVMSGWEVLDKLAEIPEEKRPVVIVLTAGSDLGGLPPELVAGTVRKPFDVDLILGSVEACVAALPPPIQSEDCPPAGK